MYADGDGNSQNYRLMSVVIFIIKHSSDMCDESLLETRILAAPAAASQLSFDKVGIEVKHQATIAATATNTAVHVPWLVIALRPIDTLRMAEPATKIQSE